MIRSLFRFFALLLTLAAAVLSQAFGTDARKVTVDEAKAHLIEYVAPTYPALAKAARIQGKVRLQATITEAGSVTSTRVLSGHPMLVPSALEAVKKWRFTPFAFDGKAESVIAELEVEFSLGLPKEEMDRYQQFQDNYWPAIRAAEKELPAGNYSDAEKHLAIARHSAELAGDHEWLSLAGTISMQGNLAFAQRNLPQAEALYREALAMHQAHQKPDEAEVGTAYSNLGICLLALGKMDEAGKDLASAVDIFKVRVRDTPMEDAKKHYRRTIALDSLGLARLGEESGNLDEFKSRCSDALQNADAMREPDARVVKEFCSK